jgi:predicted 3-demethylubiquinone-9 3-methyltransferase (glyoxalase superfamily)
MANTITPFLMFTGQAEQAMSLYVSVFPRSEVQNVVRYGPEEEAREGTVMRADFTLGGQKVICIDSPAVHDFTFTPSFSFFVECEDEEELDTAFGVLSEGGEILMPPENYGFSKKFCWVADRFGVSWQLNLE